MDEKLQWYATIVCFEKKCFSFNFCWLYFCPDSSLALLQFSRNGYFNMHFPSNPDLNVTLKDTERDAVDPGQLKEKYICISWWRHQMETFSALLALCAGNSSVPVNSPHKGQWRGALMFSLICVWINGWVNNPEAGDLRRYRAHYDVTGTVTGWWSSFSLPTAGFGVINTKRLLANFFSRIRDCDWLML